ncbi:MAG TPA: L-threonylcarbamoyladenylate synthase [Agitococcus sp.]|jgi:tRNA threonylcarbamoyl adenosine modification protein (Sua5/YciO/YrdC/YwlC family)|nr:threonylcarbamoyl-AMP synthase [Moraxellaceae bacterium]HQV80391.1 L-threonylcarbamoyladenylate synthase [Agitococcus sp.]MBK8327118.1 threonylcarbamoyl-AMP synthase [Moraxellaceae bacterium]MBK9185398.1 threonylcarbamoyl-AMP synthase [Moraxellaceae bacterium]MBL0231178.1 threonylcarbamoyl-AMP synthase [Moraxellaceae bacterium]
MTQYFHIHSDNPQARLIKQAVQIINDGGVVAYPTDSGYALGCHLGDKSALERIIRLRDLSDKHHFTLMCRDLSEIATYAKVDNATYRLLKAHTPAAYTFILVASSEVPRRLMHPKRKTIGLRVPNHAICQALLAELNEPMLTTSLLLPNEVEPLFDPDDIVERIGKQIDLVINGGFGTLIATTMIDLTQDSPVIIREGAGDISPFV